MKPLLFVLFLVFCSSVSALEQSDDDEWTTNLYELLDAQHVADISDGGHARLLSIKEDLVVEFMLFTRENPENYTLLSLDNEDSLRNFDTSKDVKIVIHGWRNGFFSPLGEILKEAYLKNRDLNVIVLDWSSKSFNNYMGSRMSVAKVADKVVELMEELVKRGLDLDKVHLIGHSLGAHIAGITGLRLKSGQVSRVTGLDPAAPMFTAAEQDILQPSSAKFVDVIHTCGYMLGFISPLGHADFYPNKGTPAQPGCGFDYKGECSHSRAYELFAESISSNQLLAIQCEDATAYEEKRCFNFAPVPMGEHCPETARGMFFLKTNKQTPFARGPPLTLIKF